MNNEVIGYRALRRLIGLVGFFLPAALAVGNQIFAPGHLAPSISDYYYTSMRNVLVIALGGIGFFLWTYKGYEKDYIPARLAGLFAIGVALCPTVPAHPDHFNNVVGIFHGIFAGLLFVTMTYMSGFLFTKSDKAPSSRTRKKRQRNVVYIVCACIMGGALLAIYPVTHTAALARFYPMFFLESVTIMAFGFSWLTKGQAIPMLRDKEKAR